MSDGPLHFIRRLPPRVVHTWLQEFGYHRMDAPTDAYEALDRAMTERGLTRLATELDVHAKRLAERAQMGPATRITGRTGVIK